jgi:hypothetical protein
MVHNLWMASKELQTCYFKMSGGRIHIWWKVWPCVRSAGTSFFSDFDYCLT